MFLLCNWQLTSLCLSHGKHILIRQSWYTMKKVYVDISWPDFIVCEGVFSWSTEQSLSYLGVFSIPVKNIFLRIQVHHRRKATKDKWLSILLKGKTHRILCLEVCVLEWVCIRVSALLFYFYLALWPWTPKLQILKKKFFVHQQTEFAFWHLLRFCSPAVCLKNKMF